jgi:hypothetical protein
MRKISSKPNGLMLSHVLIGAESGIIFGGDSKNFLISNLS